MYNFELTKYYNTNSDLHNMNPFCKIICTLIFTFLVLFTNKLILLLIFLIFTILLMILSNVPIRLYIKNIKFILPFIIFIFIINLIFNVSLLTTIISVVKLLLFIFYSSILSFTTQPTDLTYGLEKLFSPLKIFNVNVSAVALSISLAIRFIPIIFNQASKVIKSQMSRGLIFNGTLKEKCNKLISILFPIFVLSFKRSDDIANALELRLYSDRRTIYKKYNTSGIDESIVFAHIILVFIFIVVEVLK